MTRRNYSYGVPVGRYMDLRQGSSLPHIAAISRNFQGTKPRPGQERLNMEDWSASWRIDHALRHAQRGMYAALGWTPWPLTRGSANDTARLSDS